MHTADVQAKITGFIVENFLYMRPDATLEPEASLLGNGIVDSMGVMEILSFLEEELGVTVADTDVTEENLGSVAAITRYVLAHRTAQRHIA